MKQQIHFTISKLISNLTDKLKNHKLAYNCANKKLQIDIQFLHLEQGLYFLSGKIMSETQTEIIHVAEVKNEWIAMLYLEQDLNLIQKIIPAGIYTIFGDCDYKTILNANTELKIYFVMAHRNYLKIYDLLNTFDAINKQNNELYYTTFTKQTILILDSLKTKTGKIKRKQSVFDLITQFTYSEQEVAKKLRKDIDVICQFCMEQRINISTYLIQNYNLNKNELDSLFYEVFGTNIKKYYKNFQFLAVKAFFQEIAGIDKLLSNNLKSHTPYLKPIIEKFDLDEKTFKKLFFSEFGENISDYYQKIRLNVAKDYLINKKMKVKLVAERLGYKHTIKFNSFIRKYEGCTPRQFCIKQKSNG